jgi:hypothetical protein
MKQIIFLFTLVFSGLTWSQANWRSLPPNPFVPTSMTDLEIGMDAANRYYMFYPVYNTISNNFDVHVDEYSITNGWVHNMEIATTNNTYLTIKAIQNGTNVTIGFQENNSGSVRILSFNSGAIVLDYQQTLSNLDTYSNWKLVKGSDQDEIYVHYQFSGNSYLYGYTSLSGLFTSYGNPLSGEAISANDTYMYGSNDSVFFVGKYSVFSNEQYRMVAADKTTMIFNAYNPPVSDLYSMNSGVEDTLKGFSPLFMLGTNDYTAFLSNDQGTNLSFHTTPSGYSEQQLLPAELTFNAQVGTGTNKSFFITSDPTHPLVNVVYEKPTLSNTWTLTTGNEFENPANTVNYLRLKVNASERAMIGYVDFSTAPAEAKLKILNTAPVITDNGFDTDTLCSGSYVTLISNMNLFDGENDLLSLVSITSSNTSLIDPATIYTTFFIQNAANTLFYADYTVPTVATNQTVTLTFTITDGFDLLQFTRTYTILAIPTISSIQDPITVCGNTGLFDLNTNINGGGGSFSSYGGFEPSGIINTMDLGVGTYTVNYSTNTNGCNSGTSFTLEILDVPVITAAIGNATGCLSQDGQVEATVIGGATPYLTTWNTGNITDLSLYNLTAGNYHLDVVDANGCISEATYTVENTGVSVTAQITPINCHGNANGAIDLTVSGAAAPYEVYWTNGKTVEDITDLQPGMHTVYIIDANGCEITQNFEVTEPEPLNVLLYSSYATCGNSDGLVEVFSTNGGISPYDYLWNTGATASSLPNSPSGLYTVTVTDANGCTASASIGINNDFAPFVNSTTVSPVDCGQNNGSITLDTIHVGSNVQFEWSNNATTLNQTNIGVGQYVFDIYNDSGCHNFYVIDVEPVLPAAQPICILTVDSTTTTNLVVWEKVNTALISYYNIYRETSISNQFMLIDTVQDNNLSIFNDVVASPIAQSWRYKIAAVDECGFEGPKSTGHKTMHLTTIDLGTGEFKVVWNFYYGISYANFKLYRYTFADGWTLIATLPSSLNYFIDTPTNTAGLDYMVELDLGVGCVADYEKAQDFNTTRSNKDRGQFVPGEGTGVSNNSLTENTIDINYYPNPTNGTLQVEVSENAIGLNAQLFTIDGQLVLTERIHQATTTLNLASLKNGYYLLRLEGSSESYAIIKQ